MTTGLPKGKKLIFAFNALFETPYIDFYLSVLC